MKKILMSCCLAVYLVLTPLISFANSPDPVEPKEVCEVGFKVINNQIYNPCINKEELFHYINYFEVRKDNADGEIIWTLGTPPAKTILLPSWIDIEPKERAYLIPGTYRIWAENFVRLKNEVRACFPCKIFGWEYITITPEDVTNSNKGIPRIVELELNHRVEYCPRPPKK